MPVSFGTGDYLKSTQAEPRIRRADAVLEPAHAFGAGLDARVVVGFRNASSPRLLRVDRLGDPEVDVGPAVAETLGVQRAHAVDGEALLFEIGHAVVQDPRSGSPWIS